MMPPLLRRLALDAVVTMLCMVLAFAVGLHQGRSGATARTATATLAATVQAATQAKADTQRHVVAATRTGLGREADRAAIDTFFTHLAAQATQDHEAFTPGPGPGGICSLDADGLRLWALGNAGPFSGAAGGSAPAAQPADSAAEPAPTPERHGGRSAAEPPAGDPGLPPAGQQVLPAAELPAAGPRRLRGLDDHDPEQPTLGG